MGFHVSWMTALGKPPSVIRKELGLTGTNEREYVPESDVTGVLLPSGWYMVFFNEPLPSEFDDAKRDFVTTKTFEGIDGDAFTVLERS